MLAIIEKESNGIGTWIHNQEGNTNEECSHLGDSLVGMKVLMFTILAYHDFKLRLCSRLWSCCDYCDCKKLLENAVDMAKLRL